MRMRPQVVRTVFQPPVVIRKVEDPRLARLAQRRAAPDDSDDEAAAARHRRAAAVRQNTLLHRAYIHRVEVLHSGDFGLCFGLCLLGAALLLRTAPPRRH